MSQAEASEVVYVVPGANDDVPAVARAVGGEATDTGRAVDVRFVVDRDRRGAVAESLDAATLPDAVTVTVLARDDPLAFVRSETEAGGIDRVVVGDADLRSRLGDSPVPVETLPSARPASPRRLVHERSSAGFALTFVLSYAFYLALGDPTAPFDLVTGAVTAGLVAGGLSAVVVETSPSAATVAARALRATLFLPYLLYEVARANLGVAYVILHPSLPIDPELVEYDPGTRGPFERAVLGNAITLTPGTVTVDAGEEGFLVHTLTPRTRAGLREGSLARAVAWVFHGSDRS